MLNLSSKLTTARRRIINTVGKNPDAVFIWIPKSAGTSLFNSLEALGCVKCKELWRIPRAFPQKGLVTFGHMDYARLVEESHVSSEFDARAKKFAIVRNPYDRAASLYFYIRDRHRHFELWHKTPSFEEFLELVQSGFHERIGLYNNIGMSQANPQVSWTRNVDLDVIGRVERMDEAVSSISALIGMEVPAAGWLNRTEKPTAADLFDKRTRALVDRIYDEDFETFGYARLAS